MVTVDLLVRPAIQQDQQQLANLLYFESHVHRHLDWRPPLEWLGAPLYWVAERDREIQAALACPEDPPQLAWIRLFTHKYDIPSREAWQTLWPVALAELSQHSPTTVASIVLHDWMEELLVESGFTSPQQINMLEWRSEAFSPLPNKKPIRMRQMEQSDLDAVAKLDAAAFEPRWQNSRPMLERAFKQGSISSVAEDEQGIVGYQISTQNPFGVHLARLAVQPGAQRGGIGTTLLSDLIAQATSRGLFRITVNTQSDNIASLNLYKKMGFKLTGETYPIYEYPIISS